MNRLQRSFHGVAYGEGGCSVLLAEDDDDFRTYLAAALSKRGYRVIEARHGGELLACVADFALLSDPWLDVIVTDLRMPQANGATALQALRRLGSHVKIVVMSAFLDDSMRTELMGAGANACLAKPFPVEQLLRLLPVADARGG
jgi:two-component system, cell cycle sensor histidine kinase and response regulator CckA